MAGGAITISRRKYAAGLFWQPLAARGNARETARKVSRSARVRASLFTTFNGMIGLANRRGGISSNMPVLAAEVMESLNEQTFLAAFSIMEGWWIFAVRSGVIVRDSLVRSIGDAQSEYMELNRLPDWGRLIAPTDWNAPSAVERRLSDLVLGKGKHRLANISHLPGYLMTLAVLAGAAYLGYVFFEQPIKKLLTPPPERMDIKPEVVAEYKMRLGEIDTPAPKAPPKKIRVSMPYENLPKPADKADQCWRAIAFLSQQITGWVVESASCTDGEANAHLVRTHGTIGGLYEEVGKKMPNVKISETGGSDVILTARLKPLEAAAGLPKFTSDEIMTAVQSVFQKINEDVGFNRDFKDLDIPEVGENEALSADVADIPIVRIDARSKLRPSEFIKIMDGVESMEIPLVKWDNKTRTWSYEVVIYVK